MRTRKQLQEYQDWCRTIQKTYLTQTDYLKHKIYNCPVYRCPETQLLRCGPLQPQSDNVKIILRLNDFPYNFRHEEVMHYCLWSDRELAPPFIESYLRVSFPANQYVFFENPRLKRSIPDLFHVHVLVYLSP